MDYSQIRSGLIQRGEELFPSTGAILAPDYFKIQYFMERIPIGGERLMSTEEILQLYD